MADNEKHGKPISKDEFNKMVKAYKDKHPDKTHSVRFSKESFDRIFADKSVESIRCTMGENEDGTNTIVLVGVNAKGENVLTALEDRGQGCPPYC